MGISSEKLEDSKLESLHSEVEYRRRLQEICNKINAAPDVNEILINLKDEIAALFEAERITIYLVNSKRGELVSRFKSGDEIAEINIPISNNSIAGFSALNKKLVNIRNAYDDKELAGIDPSLRLDRSWDKKTGYITREVLAYPVIYQKYVMGVIQLINRKSNTAFTPMDEISVQELSKILGIAFYNQKRITMKGPSKFDYLLENNILTQNDLEKAVFYARQRKKSIELVLMDHFKTSKKEILQSLGQFYRVPYLEYSPSAIIPKDILSFAKSSFMRSNLWVPVRREKGKIVIAIDNPNDIQRIDIIKSIFKNEILDFRVAMEDDILNYIDYFTQDEQSSGGIDEILSRLEIKDSETDETVQTIGEQDSAVVQLVNKIILDACYQKASDVHIEPYPGKQSANIRFRIDGICHLYQTIPCHYVNAVVSRIKIMCDLDISERRKPQDGKIKFRKFSGKDIELRVTTVPTQGGIEDVVIRILTTGLPIPLEDMGFSRRNLGNFTTAITKPYGIVFVCGPTGSGKTTTLHSALGYINKTETKIWTAEDPVEITQKGLRQVQVKPRIGLDFAAAMRAFLRADPDVIMVGEMRDKETTRIGIEASLTGHLVMSTLHTNSAPESITRLLDMGMDPFNFADAILCIMAQRLVRTLCKHCKEPYHPSRQEYEDMIREYGQEDYYNNANVQYSDDLELFKPVGCEFCKNTGYLGRMGIHELLMGTEPMKELIQSRARMEEIRNQAIRDGMTTLKQDGIEKIFGGNSTMFQVRRVCIK